MTKRIFKSILLAALAVFLAAVVLIMGALYTYFSQVQKQQLRNETALIAHAVANEGSSYFEALQTANCRITWIDADGTVLYDSAAAVAELENHLEREEIQQALLTGEGESERYSATLMEVSFYCARKLPDGTVLRLSVAQNTVFTLLLGMGQAVGVVYLAAIALSLLLAYRLSKKIVRPLNELNLEDPLSNAEYEELTPLLKRIDTQQRQLRQQGIELQRKQFEFDMVTDSMNEGLVLLSGNGIILSMNPAASRLLGMARNCTGKDFLASTPILGVQELVREALFGQHAERIIQLPAGGYQVDASPVRADGRVSGVVLLVLDITEKQRAEAMRREFSANVSHELKTPLHAISGYAELMKSGLVPQQDVAGFSEKIYGEAQRLVRLVEDIIRLSHLDEGGQRMDLEQVDLYALAEEVIGELEHPAQKAQVTLSLEGDRCIVNGYRQLLAAIVMNLCDNAIKYIRPGGTVTVLLQDRQAETVLSVADTGIGIPQEHQTRIFERFYRVDKSHSKAVGGTGLGLSIVKHAAQLHGASPELQSAPGVGTTITVRFPK